MRRDRDMPDPSPIVSQEHQHEQEAVGRSRNHEEVGRYDLADVIPQERAPGLRGRLALSHHVFCDGRLTNVDAEFQQFAVNPWCACAWRIAKFVSVSDEVAILIRLCGA